MKPIDILLQIPCCMGMCCENNLAPIVFIFDEMSSVPLVFENSLPQVLYCIQVKLILLQPLFLCGISTLNPTPFPPEAPADWWLVRSLGSFGGKSLKHKSSKLWEGGRGEF